MKSIYLTVKKISISRLNADAFDGFMVESMNTFIEGKTRQFLIGSWEDENIT